MKLFLVIFLVILFTSLFSFAQSGTLFLSGTVPDRGYTITNGTITASPNFIMTINGVVTTSAKLLPNTEYTITVVSL